MNRREFCRGALAAGMVATVPGLAGCERRAGDTSVAAISLDGREIELERAAIRELADAMTGDLLLASDPGYETARHIWNGMHDKHPALIARCANSTDVTHAVTFARARELLVAVRGGGHSWPGKSVCDGGIMIDLQPMNDVRVDAQAQRAFAGGGTLLNALDTTALANGLVTTAGVVSHTGVGGFTLGGGFGRLNRKYGLAIDNLRSVEIVTPDGQVRRVSEEQEPDLFWAVRGGGGNFGVVTEFEYQLHPFERTVLSGMIAWPIAQARDVLDFYGGWHTGLSDDCYVGPAMMTTPDGPVIAMEVVYAGDPSAGERELAPLRAIGTPSDGIQMQDYMVMQTQEDVSFGPGIRSYAKNGMVRQITPELIDVMIESHRVDPRLAMFTHTAGGAVKRVDELATAFPHRNAETMLIIGGGWTDPAEDDEAIATLRAWFAELEPFTGGYYTNIEYEDEGAASANNYGPAYPRLRQVKARYDPMNIFRLNSNIEPAAGA